MEVKCENYSVTYDNETITVNFQGSLRLSGSAEYAPIVDLLNDVIGQEPETITLH